MSNIEVGKTYNGTVKSVRNFGVFVECVEGEEGLVHISELDNCRIDKIEDVCNVGDVISVKCIGLDDKGRVRLSRRAVVCEEQGLPYEIREVKPRRFSPGGGFSSGGSGQRGGFGGGGGFSGGGRRFGGGGSRGGFGGRDRRGGGSGGSSRGGSSGFGGSRGF